MGVGLHKVMQGPGSAGWLLQYELMVLRRGMGVENRCS
jgi:hypothetical protein